MDRSRWAADAFVASTSGQQEGELSRLSDVDVEQSTLFDVPGVTTSQSREELLAAIGLAELGRLAGRRRRATDAASMEELSDSEPSRLEPGEAPLVPPELPDIDEDRLRAAWPMDPSSFSIFICPITHEVLRDPVVCGDGHTYERAAIARWLEKSQLSPVTGQKLPHLTTTPNHAVRTLLRTLMEMAEKKKGELCLRPAPSLLEISSTSLKTVIPVSPCIERSCAPSSTLGEVAVLLSPGGSPGESSIAISRPATATVTRPISRILFEERGLDDTPPYSGQPASSVDFHSKALERSMNAPPSERHCDVAAHSSSVGSKARGRSQEMNRPANRAAVVATSPARLAESPPRKVKPPQQPTRDSSKGAPCPAGGATSSSAASSSSRSGPAPAPLVRASSSPKCSALSSPSQIAACIREALPRGNRVAVSGLESSPRARSQHGRLPFYPAGREQRAQPSEVGGDGAVQIASTIAAPVSKHMPVTTRRRPSEVAVACGAAPPSKWAALHSGQPTTPRAATPPPQKSSTPLTPSGNTAASSAAAAMASVTPRSPHAVKSVTPQSANSKVRRISSVKASQDAGGGAAKEIAAWR
eukprot:TRINITY_DN22674_c0_g1_i1.p1 TRINITY_DN22674_c0_g1~~TRINITY_DN22674_c0_g1_i1.p1  ORF type:complete len:587 (+),score=62.22 TRINITY_DN22674_c0_g1_i1:199-1959(+)